MTGDSKPILSDASRKALANLGSIKFNGYANTSVTDAELAVSALFDLSVDANGGKVNTGNEAFKIPGACIRSFLESVGRTEACMRKPNAINIHDMTTIGNQAEAKDLVRSLIKTLSDEIQRNFPKDWDEASRNIGRQSGI